MYDMIESIEIFTLTVCFIVVPSGSRYDDVGFILVQARHTQSVHQYDLHR